MANDATPEMVKFMEDQLGGKEAVYREFIGLRLVETVTNSKTVGDLLDVAEKEGWIDSLRATNMNTLFRATPRKSTQTSARSPRLTQQDKLKLQDSIMAYLRKHPKGSGKAAIVEAIGFESSKVAPQLRVLRDSKMVTSKGAKSKMVYFAKK